MKKVLSFVFPFLAFLFRIINIIYDYEANEFIIRMYYPILFKMGKITQGTVLCVQLKND